MSQKKKPKSRKSETLRLQKKKTQRKSGWTESSCRGLTFEPPSFVLACSHKTHTSIISRMTVSTVSSCCHFRNFFIYGRLEEKSGWFVPFFSFQYFCCSCILIAHLQNSWSNAVDFALETEIPSSERSREVDKRTMSSVYFSPGSDSGVNG